MPTDQFNVIWASIQAALQFVVEDVQDRVFHSLPAGFRISDVMQEDRTDARLIRFQVVKPTDGENQEVILTIAGELIDGFAHQDEGYRVCVTITGPGNLAMGGYQPGLYTPDVYCHSADQLRHRIEKWQTDKLADYIVNCLHNPYLVKAAAERGINL